MKDLQAKVETLFTLMDNNEQRFKIIEQSLTHLPFIQQSLASLSQMIEASQTIKPQGESAVLNSLVVDSNQISIDPSLDAYAVDFSS